METKSFPRMLSGTGCAGAKNSLKVKNLISALGAQHDAMVADLIDGNISVTETAKAFRDEKIKISVRS